MRPARFLGDSAKALRAFPLAARKEAGFQLEKIQRGLEASDSKPIPEIAPGIEEIRVWSADGTYRVIYTARHAEAVYVLHAFQKKTQKLTRRDTDLIRLRVDLLRRIRYGL